MGLRRSRPDPGTGGRARRPLPQATTWLAIGLSVATVLALIAHVVPTSPTRPAPSPNPGSRPAAEQHAITIEGHPKSGSERRSVSGDLVDARAGKSPSSTSVGKKTGTPGSAPTVSSTTAPAPPTTTVPTTTPGSAAPTTIAAAEEPPGVPISTAPSPTTTVAPRPLTEHWSGTLRYPSDVRTSYAFETTGGAVVVEGRVLSSDHAALDAALSCPDGHVAMVTGGVLELSTNSKTGTCLVEISLPLSSFTPGVAATYALVAHYEQAP